MAAALALVAAGLYLGAEAPVRHGVRKQPPARVAKKAIALFNGRDLDGWTTWLVDTRRADPRRVFTVVDRQIRISGDGFGYLSSECAYRDYRLVVEFRWGDRNWRSRRGKARDSGVFLHSVGPDGNSIDGQGAYKAAIECQVMEGSVGDILLIKGKYASGKDVPVEASVKARAMRDREGWPYWDENGSLVTLKRTGRFNWYAKDPAWRDEFGFRGKNDVEKPTGKWNRLECECDGGRIRVRLNGKLVNEVQEVFPRAGKILLQCEGSEIFFRRVELQPLREQ